MPPGGGKLCAIFPRISGVLLIVFVSIIGRLTPKPNASGRGETICNFSQDFPGYFYYYCEHYRPSYPKTECLRAGGNYVAIGMRLRCGGDAVGMRLGCGWDAVGMRFGCG